jgi:CYTH domain-containing protein
LLEIERKFRVQGQPWQGAGRGVSLRQGYLARGPRGVVRVRCSDGEAWITIKGKTHGFSRPEFEYAIPRADAEQLLALCEGEIVEKTRYHLEHRGSHWEIDVFHGRNEGLVVAEIELDSESATFARPDWLGREVSGEPRYANSNLSTLPYALWSDGD